ncbi:hypothetical protein E2P81_ATG03608 [Venturia nashicola]|nr:hypothetical protein E2P81_ATG03608 [Venturia nashicola]
MPIVPFQHIGLPAGTSISNQDFQISSTPADMSQFQQQQVDNDGPYQPQIWQLGGRPEVDVDVPITAVFLALFVFGAITHMTIFQLNRKKGHKFLMSALMFGFCMARTVTCILRIAWTTHVTNISLGLAAQIFVAIGVIILYVVNLIFTQRLIRASHPRLGWNPIFSGVFKALYALIAVTIIMLIVVTIQSFFTLDTYTRRIDRDIQLYGTTCFAILSFLPIPMVCALLVIPRSSPLDKFGRGRWRTKIFILLAGATLICFGAAYRCGTSWLTPVPLMQPMPNYFNKAAFYIANFGVEVLTVYLYALVRVDTRFHVPNGASKRKSYNPPPKPDEEKAEETAEADVTALHGEDEKKAISERKLSLPRVYSEEETFDDQDVVPSSPATTPHRQSLPPPTAMKEEKTLDERYVFPASRPATLHRHSRPLSTAIEGEESDFFPSPLPTHPIERSRATSRPTSALSGDIVAPVFM